MFFWVFNLESDLCTWVRCHRTSTAWLANKSYLHPGIKTFSACLFKIFLRLEDDLVSPSTHLFILQPSLIGSSWRQQVQAPPIGICDAAKYDCLSVSGYSKWSTYPWANGLKMSTFLCPLWWIWMLTSTPSAGLPRETSRTLGSQWSLAISFRHKCSPWHVMGPFDIMTSITRNPAVCMALYMLSWSFESHAKELQNAEKCPCPSPPSLGEDRWSAPQSPVGLRMGTTPFWREITCSLK